jgi:ribose 1,5-bisphosphokinase PhnN
MRRFANQQENTANENCHWCTRCCFNIVTHHSQQLALAVIWDSMGHKFGFKTIEARVSQPRSVLPNSSMRSLLEEFDLFSGPAP